MWIREEEDGTSTECGTYPHVPDEARMNNHQASYLLSICLIFEFILASSVPCGEVRLQNNANMKLNPLLLDVHLKVTHT